MTQTPPNILAYLQAEYGLDEFQAPAVNHLDGPALVMACAGSGKTTALTARVIHLIHYHKIPAEQILCITFTNKATDNMVLKITKKLGEGVTLPHISTIHSLGLSIIRSHPKLAYDALAALAKVPPEVIPGKEFNIKDYYLSIWSERNCGNAFREICKESEVKDPGDLLDQIYYLTNRGFTPDLYEVCRETDLQRLRDERFFLSPSEVELWQKYLKVKFENKVMDFQDMMLIANKVLERSPKTLEKYYQKWRYILQDEAQDASPLQWRLLELLTNPVSPNIYAVGDVSQSIMGFNGAEIKLIQGFKKEFKGQPTSFFHLGNNYRSHPTIIAVANIIEGQLIGNHPAPMVAKAGIVSDTPALSYTEYQDAASEALDIVRTIRNLADIPVNEKLLQHLTMAQARGHALRPKPPGFVPVETPKKPFKMRDIVILVRTKLMIPSIENALLLGHIPYYVKDGKSLLQSKEVVDLLAYLKLLINPYDTAAFERATQTPKRGFGSESVRKLVRDSRLGQVDLVNASRREPKLNLFVSLLDLLRNVATVQPQQVSALIDLWMEKLEYTLEIDKAAKDPEDKNRRLENIRRFSGLAQEVMTTSAFDNLGDLLDHITLMQEAGAADASDDRVHIMTAHSAKGLEYQVVFAPCFFEGAIPHTRSMKKPDELAEEARLVYVIVTRAIRQLRISRPYMYASRGATTQVAVHPSRFFEPMRHLFNVPGNKL